MEGRGDSRLQLLAVTVLTSFDRQDLAELGYDCEVSGLVSLLAPRAMQAGVDGVVASPLEAASVRADWAGRDPGDAGSALGRRRQGRSEASGHSGRSAPRLPIR